MLLEENSLIVGVQEIFQTIIWDPVTVIIGILFLLSFFSILYYLFVIAPLVLSSKKWPHVTGKIIKSRLESRGTTDPNDGVYTIEYCAELEYSYQIKGKHFFSRKINLFKNGYSIRKKSTGILDKYPRGTSVKVFYNPKKPSIAVLETGGVTRLIIIIISLMITVGVMTALLMFTIRTAAGELLVLTSM